MMKFALPLSLSIFLAAATLQAQETKITVMIRGVVNERCAEVLRADLKKVPGIQWAADSISPGDGKQHFCPPFVIEIADLKQTDIGALAAVVGKSQTPSRAEVEPRLNLVLYPDERITEEMVVALRSELSSVNGVLPDEPGGLGGVPPEGYLWLRLEDAGGAHLEYVLAAIEKAKIKVKLTQ